MKDAATVPEQHLREMLHDLDTAMLVTYGAGGETHARPMSIAEFADDILFFPTGLDTRKVADVRKEPRAHVVIQDGQRFVSLAGRARVLKDRALVERLWKETWKLWFPEGKDDPNLCILAFAGDEGEYWDNSGVNALKFMFKSAKAYVTGTQPRNDEAEYGKATLR